MVEAFRQPAVGLSALTHETFRRTWEGRSLTTSFVLNHIPMLGQRAVGYTQDVRGDPGRRLAESRESSVDHHQVAFRDDHSRLILQRRGHALDQIEQAFASGRDVSAVLDVVGRPEALTSRPDAKACSI